MIREIFSKIVANVSNVKIGFLLYLLFIVPILLAIKIEKEIKKISNIMMNETLFFVDKKTGMICRIKDGKPLEHYGVGTRWTDVPSYTDSDRFFKYESVDK